MGLFDGFEDLFSIIFDKTVAPYRDTGYNVLKKDKGYVISFNTAGMSKDDIRVNIETRKGMSFKVLHIKGESEIKELNYKCSIDKSLKLNFPEEIDSVSYNVTNGLTIIYIKIKSNPEEKIEIKPCDDDPSVDW